MSKCGERMVRCPNCGYEWKLTFTCKRCGHNWSPRKPNRKPKVCPNCKSPYWDKPRKNKKGGKK